MAKKKKSAKADSTPKADGGSKRQDLPGPIPAEEFEASFQKPGIGEDKATAEVGTLLADEPASDLEGYTLPDGVDPESLDADQRAELRERPTPAPTASPRAKGSVGMRLPRRRVSRPTMCW